MPLSEYEKSNKEFLEVNNKKLELENSNKELPKDLQILFQKKAEAQLMKENLKKKSGFFEKNIQQLKESIETKKNEIQTVFIKINLFEKKLTS